MHDVDPSDEMLRASASPWIRFGGGLVLGAGVVGVFVGVQTVVMGIFVPLYAKALVGALASAAAAAIPCGFGIWQKRPRRALGAIVAAASLLFFAAVWSLVLLVHGNVSLMAMMLVPLSALALAFSALAYGPVCRFAAAQAAWIGTSMPRAAR